MKFLMRLACLMLAFILTAQPTPAQAVEQLYAYRGGWTYYDVIDPASATIVEIRQAKPDPGGIGSLAFDGRRFFAYCLPTGLIPRIISIHPASGFTEIVGFPGVSQGTSAVLAFNPRTQQLFGYWLGVIHVIDPQTAQATPISQPNPQPMSVLAFHPSGVAYSMHGPGSQLCIVDVLSGQVTTLGLIQNLPGAPYDMAFSRNGDLWISMSAGSQTGIYTIDLQTLTATKRIAASPPLYLHWGGLSFGPIVDIEAYCTAKTGGIGCVPSISSLGTPSVSATSGFMVGCDDLVNNTLGQLVCSVTPDILPFQGGFLCMNGPVWRSVPVNSLGTPGPPMDCSGTLALDVNSFVHWSGGLPPGTTLYAQWVGRDPTSVPYPTSLSNSLKIVLAP